MINSGIPRAPCQKRSTSTRKLATKAQTLSDNPRRQVCLNLFERNSLLALNLRESCPHGCNKPDPLYDIVKSSVIRQTLHWTTNNFFCAHAQKVSLELSLIRWQSVFLPIRLNPVNSSAKLGLPHSL